MVCYNYFVDLIITVHIIKSKASWSSDLQFERLHDIVKINVTVQHIKSVGFQVTNKCVFICLSIEYIKSILLKKFW